MTNAAWRAPGADELGAIDWLGALTAVERGRAIAALRVAHLPRGQPLLRCGDPGTAWYGVVDGMLRIGRRKAGQPALTFSAVAPGGWFGEGTLLNGLCYRYDAEALHDCVVARLPADTFEWLATESMGFAGFLLHQLNERLAQLMTAHELESVARADERVGRWLYGLSNPRLFPRVGSRLRISQEELALLAGISRGRVGRALRELEARGLVRVQYGAIELLDRSALDGPYEGRGQGNT